MIYLKEGCWMVEWRNSLAGMFEPKTDVEFDPEDLRHPIQSGHYRILAEKIHRLNHGKN